MKFKDIDLEKDYFGHGCWNDDTKIYKYDKDMDVMIINNCVNNSMVSKNFIKLNDLHFSADTIIHSDGWFALKKISKLIHVDNLTDADDFYNRHATAPFAWEMWR